MDVVLEGVFILFNKKYDWNAAKAMMQDLNDFISKLVNFDKNHISEETLFKLRKHLTKFFFFYFIILSKSKLQPRDYWQKGEGREGSLPMVHRNGAVLQGLQERGPKAEEGRGIEGHSRLKDRHSRQKAGRIESGQRKRASAGGGNGSHGQ